MSCSGRHTLRVTGVSNLDFRAGFSSVPVSEFNHTRERPIKGTWHAYFRVLIFPWLRIYVDYHLVLFHCLPGLPTHVMLKCTGLKPPGELNLAELMSSSGRSLRTIPIPPPSGLHEHGLWRLPEFRTPSQSFFIRVTGKDDEGYRFQRLSSVSYTNVIPGKTADHQIWSTLFFTPHQPVEWTLAFISLLAQIHHLWACLMWWRPSTCSLLWFAVQ